MGKHTAGWWRVCKYAPNLVTNHDDTIGIADVAMCAPWITQPPIEERKANAILIASSPEMLDALTRVKNDLMMEYNGLAFNVNFGYINDAINRATGGEE